MFCPFTLVLKVWRNGALIKATWKYQSCVFVLIIHSKTYARFLLVNVPDRHRLLLFVHRIGVGGAGCMTADVLLVQKHSSLLLSVSGCPGMHN